MSGLKRFWIGGSGALLPLLITLIGADLAVLIDQHDQLTPGIVIGAGIRYACLFILGGFVAALHSDERSPLKLVQLGIAAPALITSYISVGPVNANVSHAWQLPSLISTAYAADPASERNPQPGENLVVSGLFSDIYKGWSRPLDRAVKKPPKKKDKSKAKRTGKVRTKKKALAKNSRPAAKPAPGTLEMRKQVLLENKKKIERELKRLENLRKK